MPITHQRVNTYMNNSAVNTVYTNSSGTRQRIILTDMHFAGDSSFYSSGDMGLNLNFYVIKRCDNISSAMTHTIFHGYVQYPYTIYANWSGSTGAGGVLSGVTTQSGIGQVGHYGSTYSTVPWSNMSYPQSLYFGDAAGQSSARGLGQCILYPGDTLRIGANKYGTAYMDFLVITE